MKRPPAAAPCLWTMSNCYSPPDLGKINPVDTFSRVARQRVVVLALPARRQGAEAEYSHTGRADHLRMHLGAFPVVELKAS